MKTMICTALKIEEALTPFIGAIRGVWWLSAGKTLRCHDAQQIMQLTLFHFSLLFSLVQINASLGQSLPNYNKPENHIFLVCPEMFVQLVSVSFFWQSCVDFWYSLRGAILFSTTSLYFSGLHPAVKFWRYYEADREIMPPLCLS